MKKSNPSPEGPSGRHYLLDEQIGFVLRKAQQRHLAIFASHMKELTPRQFAALAKLVELGGVSQNELGRYTAMDAATIKGVIDRLRKRGFVVTSRAQGDRRRLMVRANQAGIQIYQQLVEEAGRITEETLAPLDAAERLQLMVLLGKLT